MELLCDPEEVIGGSPDSEVLPALPIWIPVHCPNQPHISTMVVPTEGAILPGEPLIGTPHRVEFLVQHRLDASTAMLTVYAAGHVPTVSSATGSTGVMVDHPGQRC